MVAGDLPLNGLPLLAYVTWVIEQNNKPCSAYYHTIDTDEVAANGVACGGLMSMGTAADPRITTWGYNSAGLFSETPEFHDTVHTPVLIVEGGVSEYGGTYEHRLRDHDALESCGVPIVFFSKSIGHGGIPRSFVRNAAERWK